MLNPQATEDFLAEQARAFLVDRLIEQAAREQAPLSDIEKRMLIFSESDPDPDFTVLDAFNSKYNKEKYEARIAGLFERARKHDRDIKKRAIWREALRVIRGMDFYLLSIINDQQLEASIHAKQEEKREVFWFLGLVLVVGAYLLLRVEAPHEAWARWILIGVAVIAYGLKIGDLWRNRW